MDLLAEVEDWTAADPDPATREELQALIDAGDTAGLRARFENPLSFGTAGLRGALGAGPARMNRLVVRKTTAAWRAGCSDQGPERRGAASSSDETPGTDRLSSPRDVAEVARRQGCASACLPSPLPTPITAFAVKHLGAAAGVMITASHNPAADNGYKVYAADGAQVIPPDDAEIAKAAASAPPSSFAPAGERTGTGRGRSTRPSSSPPTAAPPSPSWRRAGPPASHRLHARCTASAARSSSSLGRGRLRACLDRRRPG